MTDYTQRDSDRAAKRQQTYRMQRDRMKDLIQRLLRLPGGLSIVLEAADALNQAAAREAADVYVLRTRWVPRTGPVIEHVYGPYASRSEADTAGKYAFRAAEDKHSYEGTLTNDDAEALNTHKGVLSYKVHKMIDERKWNQE